MTYPASFRKKVLAYKEKHNLSIRKTAAHFEIAIKSVMRWKEKPESLKTKAKPAILSKKALIQDIETHPDDFLYERAKRFNVTPAGVCLALKRLGLSRKKKSKASQ